MTTDDSIQKAIRIGERNKEIIELAHNWCAHLEVRQAGGIGLVEIQTGLPIGMRSFKCPHANAAGMAAMMLEVVALDFYDRNCVDCKQRQPVRLPNFTTCRVVPILLGPVSSHSSTRWIASLTITTNKSF